MKLLSLTLDEFRQFRGRQTLHFATDTDRNATLVYGPNGGGKTTLLNAFTWAFYGRFTDDFEQPERLINGQTWVEAGIGARLQTSVEVQFEHDSKRFEVIRVLTALKTAPDQSLADTRGQVRVLITDRRGTDEPGNPEELMSRVLPEELHRFFFFNGERIENLTRHSAYKELSAATRTLLGLDVLSRSIQHLPAVARVFEREVARLGDTTSQDLMARLEGQRDEATKLQEEFVKQTVRAKTWEDKRDSIFRRLAEHSESRALQERREAARRRRAEAEKRENEVRTNLRRLVTRCGFAAFTESLSTEVRGRFADLERKGELPAPVKGPFVEQLLERGFCVCGQELTVGSPHRRELEAFLETAGSPELESVWMRLDGLAGRLNDDRVAFHGDLNRLLRERDMAAKTHREAEEQESEISRKLVGFDDTAVQRLEQEQRDVSDELSGIQQRLGRLASDIRRLEATMATTQKEFNDKTARDAASRVAQRRVAVAREAATVLQRVETVLTEGVRQELNDRIATTYDGISARRRFPELSSAFELRLYEEDTDGTRRLAPNSTGENTILALSFVGGLVHYARDQAEGRIDETLKVLVEGRGGVYPIVIDAAFGNLDQSYRVEIARALPRLASQLVAFLSKAQAEGVAGEFAGHLGRRYIIVSYVAKADRDEDLVVDGKPWPYRRVCDLADERAELVEIK